MFCRENKENHHLSNKSDFQPSGLSFECMVQAGRALAQCLWKARCQSAGICQDRAEMSGCCERSWVSALPSLPGQHWPLLRFFKWSQCILRRAGDAGPVIWGKVSERPIICSGHSVHMHTYLCAFRLACLYNLSQCWQLTNVLVCFPRGSLYLSFW